MQYNIRALLILKLHIKNEKLAQIILKFEPALLLI